MRATMNQKEARHLLGQIFALRFPRSWDQIDLNRFPVANYIIFRDAFEPSFEASRRRIHEARDLLRGHDIGALFMMDEEGGRVTQISEFFPSAPSPRAIARSLTPMEAGAFYAQLAAYLAYLGININLAPCLDVNTEVLNPVIGTRSLGTYPEQVAAFAHFIIPAMQKSVACVAKHFPGHGMTRLDSHVALPTVDEPRQTLEAAHVAPFREAIKARVDGIMVSHCVYTCLQTDNLPASLSRQVVIGYLRESLGFQGAVFTDSLDMRAVTETVPPEKAARLAFEAGCDILLYTEFSERFAAAFDALVEMLATGRLSEQLVWLAVNRRSRIPMRLVAETAENALSPSGKRHQAFDEDIYRDLLDRARIGSVRIDKGQDKIPLSFKDAILVATPPAVTARLRTHIPSLREISEGENPAGKTLLLWLMEPLVLRQSLGDLRQLISRAQTSILVTTYDAIADELQDADVRIISDDSGPFAEDILVRLVFKSESGQT